MLFTEQLARPLPQGRQWTQGQLRSSFHPAATEQGPSLLSSSLSGPWLPWATQGGSSSPTQAPLSEGSAGALPRPPRGLSEDFICCNEQAKCPCPAPLTAGLPARAGGH